MKSKAKSILLLIAPVIAIVLEILPYGAVLNFKEEPGTELIRKTYSYFNLMPFGYANFGPFLTAILTCLILVLITLFIIMDNKTILKTILIVSIIGFLTSLMPLLYGTEYFSLIGLFISILFGIEIALSALLSKCRMKR